MLHQRICGQDLEVFLRGGGHSKLRMEAKARSWATRCGDVGLWLAALADPLHVCLHSCDHMYRCFKPLTPGGGKWMLINVFTKECMHHATQEASGEPAKCF